MVDKEKQYKVECPLASGAFGKVFRVSDKETEKVYALKVLAKSQIILDGSLQQLKNEVDIQSICGWNPFIVQCLSYWQSRKTIFLCKFFFDSSYFICHSKKSRFSIIKFFNPI